MKPRCCVLLVCGLLTFPMCMMAVAAQVSKDPAPPVERPVSKHLLLEGVPNFGEATPMLYRGGQPKPEAFKRLARMGIDIVVDAGRSEKEERLVKKLGMRYVSIVWHCPFPKDEPLARFLKLIRDNPNKKIFVHCRLGDDRTGMMIAAYRMSRQGWTAERAMKEMHAFGFTGPHHVI
jgi:tyrosine-protein phosphatase SIW14